MIRDILVGISRNRVWKFFSWLFLNQLNS